MISGLFILGLIGAFAFMVEENDKLKKAQKGGNDEQ